MKSLTASVALLALGATLCAAPNATPLRAPAYDTDFWNRWGDGQAELAAYDIVYPRYREARRGVAVAIFVTEPFSDKLRVKSDSGAGGDTFQVIKLNLVEDFATGIYDYNLMTSAFIALESRPNVARGFPAKISFSAQEWCGQVYHQLVFRPRGIDEIRHSYFEGEADSTRTLESQSSFSEDILFLWARRLAAPVLERGESTEIDILPSLAHARLHHEPLEWKRAKLHFAENTERVSTPAGTFDTDVLHAGIAGIRDWTIWVEHAAPNRIVKWTTSDGQSGELLGAKRMKYWQMNRGGYESALRELGLTPRPERTP